MAVTDEVLCYLEKEYDPLAVILYGSFADGTQDAESDFDALVITRDRKKHDTSRVVDTVLDVFVWPEEEVLMKTDPDAYVQIADGKILWDRDGSGRRLLDKARAYLAGLPGKTEEEMENDMAWCEKMLTRALRGDTEGDYRRHWLLTDSLPIYCERRGWRYTGPKKALKKMEAEDPAGFGLYRAAMRDTESLAEWIRYLRGIRKVENA